ncbi:MAG: hypothetical protein COB90_08640, partial [Hyphomicrobiales bacterium]
LKLKKNGKIITDLDYVALDTTNNELAIIQLKWQQPTGLDVQSKRSAAKNFVKQGNDWISKVVSWLDKYGTAELAKKTGFSERSDIKVSLFMIGRYEAYFSGDLERDNRAIWTDWNQFLKMYYENPNVTFTQIRSIMDIEISDAAKTVELSTMVPLGEIALIINPSGTP